MADVYAALDMALQRLVVVKRLHPELAGDPLATERLRREGEALAGIGSRHVVALHDVGADYLVLERIHGLTLEQELERFGPLRPDRACRIALDVLAGLSAIHERNLVHRDLKPANVMLDLEDRAILLDLGIARHPRQRRLTPPGFAAGTPAYMAPEQVELASALDARVDIYQLGVLLVLATTGIELDREHGHEALFKLPGPLIDVALRAIAPAGVRFPSTAAMEHAVVEAMRALERTWPAEQWLRCN